MGTAVAAHVKSTSVERLTALSRPALTEQGLAIADGTLETLKWGAAALMVVDHTNKFLCAEHLPGVFQIGRVVMPIFAFVLAYNLARPDASTSGARERMIIRLAFFGLAAAPFGIILNGTLVSAHAWWPLNILFTLLLIVVLIDLIEKGGIPRRAAAVVLFLIGGALVEFLWFGIACGLGAWGYCRKPTALRLSVWTLAILSLSVVNQNAWALTAIPLLLGASKLTLRTPRLKWAFYALYPIHLMVLLLVKRVWF